LEGGFDRHDTFSFIPLSATAVLTEIWRRSVVTLFLDKGLLNPDFARKILSWQHSGFSIESETRILDQPTREALCQYIVRALLSLQRIRWDEQQDAVTWSSSPSGYFKGRQRRYSSLDFIAQGTLHIPPRASTWCAATGCTPPSAGSRLRSKRREARGRGTWKHHPALASRAPENWYGRNASADSALPDAPKDQPQGGPLHRQVGARSRRKAWARLLAKVHEMDVMVCPRCGSRMSVIAVIVDPAQIRKIIACLERHGRGPPLPG
jgi:hypothetical protein